MNNVIQENAVKGIMNGVKICVDLIAPTYGGNGKNVIIQSNLNPGHMIVNDAQSIIQSIKATDPAEKIGVNFIKELCDKADKVSGDARKTTILLANKILEEGYKGELSKIELKKQLDDLIPFIESEIDKETTQITVDNCKGVASTASESEETGALIQEIYQNIGKNGILNIEGSKTYETSIKYTNGVRFQMTGMLSPEMTHKSKTSAIYENPLILVTKKKITTDEDINPLLSEMRMEGMKDLVIFTNDMDSNVASMLVNLHKGNEFNILIIKAPTLWQDFVFEDFAKCTGSTIVEDKTGLTLKTLQLKHLGTCGRIEVDTEDTVLTGIQDITDHLKYLQEKGDDDSKLRLAWLATKSAVLKLGANSETDLSYKLLKAYDANRSTYLALQYGVVRGGGTTLWNIADVLPTTEAGKVLKKALEAPMNQAILNYDINTNSYAELITENIVDSAMVIKRAVRNAIGIASTILTASALVYIPDLTQQEIELAKLSKNNYA